MPSVVILLHATDCDPEQHSYFAWGLRDVWREMGAKVSVVRGTDPLPAADLVLPHIDLTVTPPAYQAVLDRTPHVLNRGLYDISKRRVSNHLVTADDAWDGPVIVKTDCNFGGLPELRVAGAQRPWRARMSFRRRQRQPYRIYERRADVPKRIFRRRDLIVERFLPERAGDLYFIRWYIFCGDRYRSMRVASRNPIVKLAEAGTREYGLPVPPEVVALRKAWGMDFGKIDYLLHNKKPVILDVNRTPADVAPPERIRMCRPYGPALHALLARAAGDLRPLVHVDVDA